MRIRRAASHVASLPGRHDPDLNGVIDRIHVARLAVPSARSPSVAVTGIDGCGKGYVAARIVDALNATGVGAAGINIDGWLNLPNKRFDPSNPAEHFYVHAIRFEEMFAQLIVPLRDRRSVRLEADHAAETAKEYRRHLYEFDDIDVVCAGRNLSPEARPSAAL